MNKYISNQPSSSKKSSYSTFSGDDNLNFFSSFEVLVVEELLSSLLFSTYVNNVKIQNFVRIN